MPNVFVLSVSWSSWHYFEGGEGSLVVFPLASSFVHNDIHPSQLMPQPRSAVFPYWELMVCLYLIPHPDLCSSIISHCAVEILLSVYNTLVLMMSLHGQKANEFPSWNSLVFSCLLLYFITMPGSIPRGFVLVVNLLPLLSFSLFHCCCCNSGSPWPPSHACDVATSSFGLICACTLFFQPGCCV